MEKATWEADGNPIP